MALKRLKGISLPAAQAQISAPLTLKTNRLALEAKTTRMMRRKVSCSLPHPPMATVAVPMMTMMMMQILAQTRR